MSFEGSVDELLEDYKLGVAIAYDMWNHYKDVEEKLGSDHPITILLKQLYDSQEKVLDIVLEEIPLDRRKELLNEEDEAPHVT